MCCKCIHRYYDLILTPVIGDHISLYSDEAEDHDLDADLESPMLADAYSEESNSEGGLGDRILAAILGGQFHMENSAGNSVAVAYSEDDEELECAADAFTGMMILILTPVIADHISLYSDDGDDLDGHADPEFPLRVDAYSEQSDIEGGLGGWILAVILGGRFHVDNNAGNNTPAQTGETDLNSLYTAANFADIAAELILLTPDEEMSEYGSDDE